MRKNLIAVMLVGALTLSLNLGTALGAGKNSERSPSNSGVACEKSSSTKAASGNSRAQTCVYTISLNPGAGTVSPTSLLFQAGGEPKTLPTPTRSNYDFTGWFTAASGGIPITSPYTPTSSLTLYAQYSRITLTLSLDAGAGTVSPTSYPFQLGGTPITLPTPTRSNYDFTGWFTAASGGSAIASPYTPTSSLTLYAQYSSIAPGGDGLTSTTAGNSAFQIKRDFPNSPDGLYWIKNSNVNSNQPFQVYADMTGYGGGWTLIFVNAAQGAYRAWTNEEVQSINSLLAPSNPKDLSAILGKYSILNFADYLKSKPSGFQYRIDASEFGRYGGIWTANADYSFSDFNNNLKTNISEVAIWDYFYMDNGIEKRMPWASDGSGRLTTSEFSSGGAWWGTLASSDSNWGPAPWISPAMEAPQSIWYWVR